MKQYRVISEYGPVAQQKALNEYAALGFEVFDIVKKVNGGDGQESIFIYMCKDVVAPNPDVDSHSAFDDEEDSVIKPVKPGPGTAHSGLYGG